jgi:hypothetical protein
MFINHLILHVLHLYYENLYLRKTVHMQSTSPLYRSLIIVNTHLVVRVTSTYPEHVTVVLLHVLKHPLYKIHDLFGIL